MERLLEIAIGNALSASILAVLVALASNWIKRPTVRHALWALVLVRLVAPTIFEIGLLPPKPSFEPVPVTISAAAETASPVALPSLAPTVEARDVLLSGWVLVAFGTIGLALIRSRRFATSLSSSGSADQDLEEIVDKIARAIGVRSPVLKVVDVPISPVLWAPFGRAMLVLPGGLLKTLDQVEREALIAHELAHLKRGDHWIRYLELVTTAAFWWLPISWWARHSLRLAEEECCDALVAETLPGHRRAYAECLIKTVDFLSTRKTMPTPGTAFANFRDLEGRLTMIMTSQTDRPTTVSRACLVLLAITLLAFSPTLSARDEPLAHASSAETNSEATVTPTLKVNQGGGLLDEEESTDEDVDRATDLGLVIEAAIEGAQYFVRASIRDRESGELISQPIVRGRIGHWVKIQSEAELPGGSNAIFGIDLRVVGEEDLSWRLYRDGKRVIPATQETYFDSGWLERLRAEGQ